MRLAFLVSLFFVWSFADVKATVSILPQKFFVEKIGADKVDVTVMVQPGNSPATYEPSPKQMMQLSKSELYFFMGVPFEKRWLKRFKDVASNTTFVDSAKGIERLPIAKHSHEHEKEAHDHHDHHGDHGHDAHHDEKKMLDPHIWLSPKRVKIVAHNIYEALAQADSKNSGFYKKNYETFMQELVDLDEKIKQNLSDLQSNKFIVFHPSWGYFASDYNLEQVAIEIEGKEPKQKDLVELIEFAKDEGIKVVFVAPEFSQKSAKVIAQNIGGKTITVSPLHPQWDKNLLKMSNELKEVLR